MPRAGAGEPSGWSASCPVRVKRRAPGRVFPYEATLVSLSQHLLGGQLPSGWQAIPVTHEALNAPAGLSAVPERVWVGNHLKVVRYRVTNNTGMARNIAESDFWQSGIRGVLFGEASRQLMAGGALQVFIISSGGAADGQH